MRNFKIITDSGCDLSYEIVDSLDIGYLGLECDLEGNKLIEDGGRIINYKEFYEKLKNEAMPRTSQINPVRFSKEFEKYLSDDYDILYIGFSSALSGTCNSALIAKGELLERYPESNITIVDSKAASGGQGLLVYIAAKLKEEGKNICEITQYIQGIQKKLCSFFTVRDLKYLERGGRITTASAIFGKVLNINSILAVSKDGALEFVEMARGEKRVLKELVKKIEINVDGSNIGTILITHADNYNAAQYLCKVIREKFRVKDVIINYMGLAVGSHTGYGAIGIFFLGK
jgi:DegV family protein with EDD domain